MQLRINVIMLEVIGWERELRSQLLSGNVCVDRSNVNRKKSLSK